MHGLAVRQNHQQHDHGHSQRDLPGEGHTGDSGQGEGQQDLVRGIGNRAQRVGREHRKGDPLGEQSLTQLGTGQLASDQYPLEDIACSHGVEAYAIVRKLSCSGRDRAAARSPLSRSHGRAGR